MSKILVGSNFTGFKNRIINGDFSVWQRGASLTLPDATKTYGGMVCDRMYHYANYNTTSGSFTVSKLESGLRIDVTDPFQATTTASPAYWSILKYNFEGSHLYDVGIRGGDITISFKFKSNVVGRYSVAIRNMTDSSVAVQSFVSYFDYNTADVQQTVNITIPLNATWSPALKNDENLGFELHIGFYNPDGFFAASSTSINTWLNEDKLTTPESVNWCAAAGNYIEIAELQVEEGKYATSFEKVPYDIQLLRCQRYCFISPTLFLLRYGDVFTAFAQVNLPVQMRTDPTVTTTRTNLINMSFFNSYTTKDRIAEYYYIDAAGGYGSIVVELSAEL